MLTERHIGEFYKYILLHKLPRIFLQKIIFTPFAKMFFLCAKQLFEVFDTNKDSVVDKRVVKLAAYKIATVS